MKPYQVLPQLERARLEAQLNQIPGSTWLSCTITGLIPAPKIGSITSRYRPRQDHLGACHRPGEERRAGPLFCEWPGVAGGRERRHHAPERLQRAHLGRDPGVRSRPGRECKTQQAASLQKGLRITYQNQTRDVAAREDGPDPDTCDQVMLVRRRKSRIYFLRKFFDYPMSLSKDTLRNLGALRTLRIGASYARSAIFPSRRSRTRSNSSSIASAASSTRPSSSPTRRRYGACPARRSARNGSAAGQRPLRHQGLKVTDPTSNGHGRRLIEDNWIYIQPDVAGRLQIFNNWSPHLVSQPGRV
jgi:hypothetical protein